MKPAIARHIIMLFLVLTIVPTVLGQHFGPWSERSNVGAPINSEFAEMNPFLAKDGLTLYFTRLECITCGNGVPQDIWVSHRDSVDSPWNTPEKLPETINWPYPVSNKPSIQNFAFVTIDGHYLFFISNRPGGNGRQDIYMSRRKDKKVDSGPDGWGPAMNLGPMVNSSGREQAPWLFFDETTGKTTLYFNSDRLGLDDIFSSELQSDGTWTPAAPVVELNSPAEDSAPVLSRNGLAIYFVSRRAGSLIDASGDVSADIYMATRSSTSSRWSVPQPVSELNTLYWEGRPALSFDGSEIYFNSVHTADECSLRGQCNVSTAWDIWKATRTKLTGKDK